MPAAVEAKSAEGEENGTRSLVAWPVFRPGRAGRPYRVRVLEREDGSAERTRRRLLSGNPLSPANFGPVEAAKTPRLRALLGVSASGTAGGSRPYFAARRDETKHTNERKGVALTKVRSQEGRAMFLLFRPWNQSQVLETCRPAAVQRDAEVCIPRGGPWVCWAPGGSPTSGVGAWLELDRRLSAHGNRRRLHASTQLYAGCHRAAMGK